MSRFIEIREAGFLNKGAELMQRAICARLAVDLPHARLVMQPNPISAPRARRVAAGFLHKAVYRRFGIDWARPAFLLPTGVRRRLDLVLDRELDAVLDAAGFAYSDQWGTHKVRRLAAASRRWAEQGTQLVLMPQAFGPFDHPEGAAAIREVVRNAALVFAREETSHAYLAAAGVDMTRVRIAPDFTNLLPGLPLPGANGRYDGRVCIVPNARMLDKVSSDGAAKYTQLLAAITARLASQGMDPYFLIHEDADDRSIAVDVCQATGLDLEIVDKLDPQHCKWLLGRAAWVLGSRYHALVSALSQGVPVLAAGWSHKYQTLLTDYAADQWMLDVSATEAEWEGKVSALCYPAERDVIAAGIAARATQLRAASESMWRQVLEVIR